MIKELLQTVENLKGNGIHQVSLEEYTDTSSAAGELIFHVFGVMAHFEHQLISDVRATGGDDQKTGVSSRASRRLYPSSA